MITSEALVKAILTEESCELYDKDRIENLFKNVKKGYGKVSHTLEGFFTITFISNKSRKIVYNIPNELLTLEQLSVT